MSAEQRISLVVPLFNESSRWRPHYWESLVGIEYIDWLFVDDGSTDDTHQLVAQFTEANGGELLHLTSNLGKGNAVRAGMNHAIAQGCTGVGFLDGDGAFALEDIEAIAQAFFTYSAAGETSDSSEKVGFESVWASRVALAGHNIERKASRHYLGRVIATLISTNLPNVPYDTQCGFKVFRVSDSLRACLEEPFNTNWFFDVEILQRWINETGKPMTIQEIPLLNWHDVPGSKVSTRSAGRVIREIAFVMRKNQALSS